MSVLSQHLDKRPQLLAVSEKVKKDMPQFYETNYEDFSARYTNPTNIKRRREVFEGFILSEIQ